VATRAVQAEMHETGRSSTRLLVAIAMGGLAVAVGLRIWAPHAPPYVGLEAHFICVLFVWAGVVAWARRPDSRVGRILALAGAALFVKILVFAPNALAFTVGSTWGGLFDPLIAYLALTFPTGRLTSRVWTRVFWSYAIAMYVLWPLATSLLSVRTVPVPPFPGIHFHPVNLFSVHDLHVSAPYHLIGAPEWYAGILGGNEFLTAAVVLAVVRLWKASVPARRVLAPALAPAIFTLLVTVVAYVLLFVTNQLGKPLTSAVTFLQRVLTHSYFAIPVGVLVGLYLERRERARVSRLVVELDEFPGLGHLEDSLRRTLRDRSLRVGLYDRSSGAYRSADGSPFELPEDASNLVATRLERAGAPLGLMVHDKALLENPDLMESTAAAVRMAVDNERLHQAVRDQLEEVRASRARIVEASDAERRRVERNLHDGAQQRLVSLAMSLRMARARAEEAGDKALIAELDRSSGDLDRAIAELRELAQGIHPAVLTEDGLHTALEELAERSAVPVRLSAPDERYPAPAEATAYFVASEALANVGKYSGASEVSVSVTRENGTLTVEVSDDGVGGADPTKGSGLRGLEDRLAALGGELRVESPVGRGTRLIARIPFDT
jgi:signal transduction histidine kinase